MFINLNTRSKTSIFTAYALVSVVGFAGLWFGVKGSENMTAAESFLAFYGFFCTTVIFYMLASQKTMIENAFDSIREETTDRSREMEGVYRHIDTVNDSIRRDIDSLESGSKNCCTEKASF